MELEAVVRRDKKVTDENFATVANIARDGVDEWDNLKRALMRESNDALEEWGIKSQILYEDLIEPGKIEQNIIRNSMPGDTPRKVAGKVLAQYFVSHLYAENVMKGLREALNFSIKKNQEFVSRCAELQRLLGTSLLPKKSGFTLNELKLLDKLNVDKISWLDLTRELGSQDKIVLSRLIGELIGSGIVKIQDSRIKSSIEGIEFEVVEKILLVDTALLNVYVSLIEEEPLEEKEASEEEPIEEESDATVSEE